MNEQRGKADGERERMEVDECRPGETVGGGGVEAGRGQREDR